MIFLFSFPSVPPIELANVNFRNNQTATEGSFVSVCVDVSPVSDVAIPTPFSVSLQVLPQSTANGVCVCVCVFVLP